MTIPAHEKDIVLPTEQDISLAEQSSRKLSAYIRSTKQPAIQLIRKDKGVEMIALPAGALELLSDILAEMAHGNAVAITQINAELSTQKAADLLNVSRPFLVSLLEDGKIPFRMVGAQRRVLAKDILQYKSEIDKKRLSVLDQLANEAQKNKMGY